MNLPYRILAEYRPKRWNARAVGHDLTAITEKLGFRPHVDPVHGPLPLTGRNWVSISLHAEVRRRTFKTRMAEGPHYDGDTTPGSKPDCLLALWASNTPTEIQWRRLHGYEADKEFDIWYQAEPYQLIVFRNLDCLHKRPSPCPRLRWIFRQRLSVPAGWKL